MKYQPVIGLEVHVELKTNSKMFCTCSADYFGKLPNSQTCPVCVGLPGALPVPNKKSIEWCIAIGLALNCRVNLVSKFDRKNYFYPDLPKGYQISQYDAPFSENGEVKLSNGKIVRIRRVHMEEDTGKLLHETVDGKKVSLIDFNRCGVALVEIVTEPDFDNATDVREYLQKLQQLVRYLDVSDADMEKGNMRLEPNISLRPMNGHPELNSGSLKIPDHLACRQAGVRNDKVGLPKYKVEVKNINSFSFVTKAIDYEINRQANLLDKGETPLQETRGWDEVRQKTVSQRVKEEANDYRYFPEPDIPPLRFTDSQIEEIKNRMPELPDQKLERFMKEYFLSSYDAIILIKEKKLADYFEEAVTVGGQHNLTPKQIANYLINKKTDIDAILPAKVIEIILTSTQKVTVDENVLTQAINQVLSEQQKAVMDYKSGHENVIMYLVGQVLRKLPEKVDVTIVKTAIVEKLRS